MNKISNQPPKGTADWFPEEFKIRKYIFDVWREVCKRFGYEEYLTPIVESAEVYRAKSGEDISGKELMTMVDRAGRELAIRPEMTPSVTRMVTRIYQDTPKPIRYFSIANYMRNEKPQRGRNREFWQLNFDIFGSDSINADIEVLQIALEIMLAFGPEKGSFTLFINNRKLIDFILNNIAEVSETQKTEVVRVLDKWQKLEQQEFTDRLLRIGLNNEQISKLVKFMQSTDEESLIANLPELAQNLGFLETKEIMQVLSSLGYGEWLKFQPNIIRGFDYYDGMVFEVFDNNPENMRSLFGGGRYNGLAKIFGGEEFPAVGCAPGDETTYLFLKSWGLVEKLGILQKDEIFYIPLLDESLNLEIQTIAMGIRNQGKKVITGLEVQKLGKALEYANKKQFDFVVIFGEEEKANNMCKIKDMKTGEERIIGM